MKTLAISGIDGTGKSQQIRLLRAFNPAVFYCHEPLISYGDNWPRLQGREMAKWWFEDATIDDFITIILEALRLRRNSRIPGKINVYDRGDRMFVAVCIANWMTRSDLSIEEVHARVMARFLTEFSFDETETEILLMPDDNYRKKISIYLRTLGDDKNEYTEAEEHRYEKYQVSLIKAMDIVYNSVGVSRVNVDDSIVAVQNKIRKLINDLIKVNMTVLGKGVRKIIGFGGLSESGKSSFAELLRAEHGFCRLKQRYFIERISERGEYFSPESFALEFLRFAETHYYAPDYTLESLHDPQIPAYMKLFWGDRYKIIFIEASKDVRLKRTCEEAGLTGIEASAILNNKDDVKLSRGAEFVKNIADQIIVNEHVSVRDNRSLVLK